MVLRLTGHVLGGVALGAVGEDPGWTSVDSALVGGVWWASRMSGVH